jgi:hypothetical protein
MGSVISELMTVHAGRYVVLASVQMGGTVLATGMAAAEDVEIAEDRAKVRALEALGIQSTISLFSNPLPSSSIHETQTQSVQSTKNLVPTVFSSISGTALPTDSTQPINGEKMVSPEENDFNRDPELTAKILLEESQESLETNDAFPAIASSNPDAQPEPPKPRPKPSHATFSTDLGNAETTVVNEALSNPIDLSDVIVQTSVELKRLSWTDAQGRKHLQQTYNKRSRQHLTDDELLDFLRYLQSQPTPSNNG